MKGVRTTIHIHQRLSELSILTLPHPNMEFVEPRLVFLEVLLPSIQLPENVVQPLDEICPVVSHLDSAEVLPNYDTHLVETTVGEPVPL